MPCIRLVWSISSLVPCLASWEGDEQRLCSTGAASQVWRKKALLGHTFYVWWLNILLARDVWFHRLSRRYVTTTSFLCSSATWSLIKLYACRCCNQDWDPISSGGALFLWWMPASHKALPFVSYTDPGYNRRDCSLNHCITGLHTCMHTGSLKDFAIWMCTKYRLK